MTNPYLPPSAPVGENLGADSRGYLPDGNLELALRGEIKLATMEAVREGWSRVHGCKGTIGLGLTVISLFYMVFVFLMIAGSLYFSGLGWDELSDPMVFTEQMAGLGTSPIYLIGNSVLGAPVFAWLWAAIWNMGLRRSAGHPLRLADAFPMHVLVPQSLVLLILAPLGWVAIIHPFAAYLSMPFYFAAQWTVPAFLDRGCSLADAFKVSVALTRHNLLALTGLGFILFAGYVVSLACCGIGLIWFGPFACCVLGATWRQLCGLQQTAQP